MTANHDLLAPCGLYCGVCAASIAHREGNEKFKEKLAAVYGVTAEEVRCRGCHSDEVFLYCKVCPIRSCAGEKGYEGCYQCDDFPCSFIDDFPHPVGKKVIMRAIPQWREMGTEKWVAAEEVRYRCPQCGHRLFRGAKRCRECKTPVDLD